MPFLQGEVRDLAQPIRASFGADATDARLRLALPEEAGAFFFFFFFLFLKNLGLITGAVRRVFFRRSPQGYNHAKTEKSKA